MRTLSVIAVAAIFSFSLCAAHAQQAPVRNIEPPKRAPTGIGPMQLGLTVEQVRAIKQPDFYFVDGISVQSGDPDSGSTMENIVRYRGALKSPLMDVPGVVTLGFKGGKLTKISLDLSDESGYVKSLAQLSEKYGPGKDVNLMKDQDCLYLNGARYTINDGIDSREWSEPTADGMVIETNLVRYRVEMCTPNLKTGRLKTTEEWELTIEQHAPVARQANVF